MSNHENCIHHESHEGRITRNEKDIQDIFDMIEKLQNKVALIVGGITLIGAIANYLLQFMGK